MHSGSQSSPLFPPKMTESVVVSNTTACAKSSMKMWPCKLMTWRQEVVTLERAHIGNGSQHIHCKTLSKHAYKVTIDVIEKGDVDLLYPDGYHSTLGKLEMGPL